MQRGRSRDSLSFVRILALDIGTRRTGVAYAESPPGVPLVLPTLHHASSRILLQHVAQLLRERKIEQLVVGLPLLSSGHEGKQAKHVRALLPSFLDFGVPVATLDERYSSFSLVSQDIDAAAACAILTVFLDRMPSS